MDDIHDLTAAYALDALDPHEAEAYEAHLAQCEQCRDALAALSDTAAAMAWAVDAPEPPSRLRDSILQQAADERRNVVSFPVRGNALFRVTAGVAAVAACVAVALGVVVATSHGKGCAPGWRCTAVADGRGVVTVDPAGQAVMVVRQLAAAPAGKTYEAWVIEGGAAKPAGLFTGGGSTTVVRLARPVPRGAVVAATLERSGGVDMPTSAPVFSARV
jgi:anti-sigma-K factor RskA